MWMSPLEWWFKEPGSSPKMAEHLQVPEWWWLRQIDVCVLLHVGYPHLFPKGTRYIRRAEGASLSGTGGQNRDFAWVVQLYTMDRSGQGEWAVLLSRGLRSLMMLQATYYCISCTSVIVHSNSLDNSQLLLYNITFFVSSACTRDVLVPCLFSDRRKGWMFWAPTCSAFPSERITKLSDSSPGASCSPLERPPWHG